MSGSGFVRKLERPKPKKGMTQVSLSSWPTLPPGRQAPGPEPCWPRIVMVQGWFREGMEEIP